MGQRFERWSQKESQNFIRDSLFYINKVTAGGLAIIGVSGGVDSTVAAVLVHKAIGENLKAVMVDNGLLRQGEVQFVQSAFSELGIALNVIDAKRRFLRKLKGVTDPEEKRKIIGEEFIRVFEQEARKYQDVRFLVQGTIRSDIIESGAGVGQSSEGKSKNKFVKSHHNVGGLPSYMELKLLEPFKNLYKKQVKLVGEELGLSKALLNRHPFPGPGLAVRILGEVTEPKLEILRKAQMVLDENISESGLHEELWQCFCVLPNVKTVGMKAGGRTYGNLIAIRAVLSTDAMEAQWAPLPHDLLNSTALKIIEKIPQVNRVVYDITSKPPATIEWE